MSSGMCKIPAGFEPLLIVVTRIAYLQNASIARLNEVGTNARRVQDQDFSCLLYTLELVSHANYS
jgi:hypothetical protein